MAESFGELLRRLRVAASLTQEALAERADISAAAIAAFEQGRRQAPRLSTVTRLADALAVSSAERAALATVAQGAHRPTVAAASVPTPPRVVPPEPITPLVGRDTVADELSRTLAGERLVTLVGPGGVGKTRLALRVAEESAPQFPAGTCWVDLASVTKGADVEPTLLRALGGSDHPAVNVADQLAAILPQDRVLVLVDNCEHLLDAAATAITALLEHPQATVLATSREPLAIPGEVAFRVPVLDDAGSVELFAERARRARPGYTLDDHDHDRDHDHDHDDDAVRRICRRVEGLPLAIELVAARVGAVPTRQLADELDQAIPLTAARARGVPERQSTLWSSIDWSYQQLTRAERRSLHCLAGFVGPFTAEAFAAVERTSGAAAVGALPLLVEKSLVARVGAGDGYRVLDTIRTFAEARAAESGELESIRDAHADHFSTWLSALDAGEGDDDVLVQVDAQYANIHAALLWSIEARSRRAIDLVKGFGVGWHQLDRYRDATTVADGALDIAAEQASDEWPKVVATLAMSRLLAGDVPFVATTLPVAATRARASRDRWAEAWCRLVLGNRPPFDPTELLTAYELAGDVDSPILAGLVAASVAFGGTEPDSEAWLQRADEHAAGTRNSSLRAVRDLARTDDWTERGRFAEAEQRAMAIALDPLVMPGLRLVAIGHVVQVAWLRADLELAERTMAVRQDVARIWPLGGWRFIAVDDLRVAWIRGEQPPLTDSNVLHWTTRMGITPGPIRAACRAALDGGAQPHVMTYARAGAPPSPMSLLGATFAAVEAALAALNGDDDAARVCWSRSLTTALAHGYVVLGCDAMEGLACAARDLDATTSAVLLQSAAACRDEIGYRFRFEFEQRAVDEAWAATARAADDAATLPWTDAAKLALSTIAEAADRNG
jgi:predicted ATPase/DNA-binding XRE family transcriptional regulator